MRHADPVSLAHQEAGDRLEKRLALVTEKKYLAELQSLVPKNYLQGSFLIVGAAVRRICERLRQVSE